MADQSETSHELTELHIIYMHYIKWSSLSQTYRVTYKGKQKSMDSDSSPVPLWNPRIFYSFRSFQTTDYWGFHLRRRILEKTVQFSAW